VNFANKKAELSSAFLIVFQKFKLLKGFCSQNSNLQDCREMMLGNSGDDFGSRGNRLAPKGLSPELASTHL